MASPLSILNQYWQYLSFRPQQQDVIDAVIEGKDVLAIMPTGGGKSICYQVPALLLDGVCIVISPLIALMKDQVDNLVKKGIPAAALHSGLTYYEINKILENAVNGSYKLLYVSPERLQSETFTVFAAEMSVNLIAVDESHCISQWGYDFRPSYLRIAGLREILPGVPVLAVTASATAAVEADIIEKLLFDDFTVVRQSFERPNLSFSVFKVDSKINKLVDVLNNVQGSSIVYCRNRKTTKQVAELLALQNITTGFYHAGITQEERTQRQEDWVKNHVRVMVCTNAFGLGIDKPDVRTVIHYDVPDCLENYYQEAGRAGRDGKKAYAVLIYHGEDAEWLQALPDVRFPSIYNIRKVYQALADYLKIPVGIGEGNYYDFDLGEFVRNFHLDMHLVINTFKVLEQEGHLSFNENIFLPAQVVFTASKSLLHDFEQSHPLLEPVMKCLLRTYEGIYDNRVSINEKLLAKLTRKTLETVKNDLHQLGVLGIIEYKPQKETPQVHFMLNRAPAEFLYIDNAAYLQRKAEFEVRVDAMLKFMQLKMDCRSIYIAGYFGDTAAKDCGVCDNCLARKNNHVKRDEFKEIEARIIATLTSEKTSIQKLLIELKDFPTDKCWKVIDYLQSERKIAADTAGRLYKIK
ncbi:MAG TPA: ATP-dependent DNA helicase RecQ [Chitinophagaceae bacterium]|nr:ATP-dependent DNA helicase RecQ [Chitinophagaceae bacterium]